MNNNAKFAFLYILATISLIFVAISVGLVTFFIIDKELVDILTMNGGSSSASLRFAISALIIATPIFYLASAQIYRNLKAGTLKLESGIRKWLTYLIILVSLVVMLSWLVGLINNFLGGELSSRFAVKAVVAISLALIISAFYFFDIRRDQITKKNSRFLRLYSYFALVLIIAVFSTSWFFVESPATARAQKIDQITSNNLAATKANIQLYYFQNKKLPANFTELKNNQEFSARRGEYYVNPVTKKEFVYHVLGPKKYELCANFQLDSLNSPDYSGPPSSSHQAGYQCFKYQVLSDLKK